MKFKNIFKPKFDLKLFSGQMHILLDSGLDLRRTLLALKKQFKNREYKKIINEILKKVESGSTLVDSMHSSSFNFPEFYLEIVEIGEKTASLAEVFLNLENHYIRQEKLKEEIKKSSFYPVSVLITVFTAAVFLISYILPVFSDIFSEFQGKLPLLTKVMLKFADFIEGNIFIILLLVFLIIILLIILIADNKTEDILKNYLLKTPVIGEIYKISIIARLSSYMAVILASGIGLVETLKMSADMADNSAYRKFFRKSSAEISQGASPVKIFSKSSLIPDIFYYFIAVGTETGNLEYMMQKAGDYYYDLLNKKTENILQYLEPSLILITAVCVGLISAAVIMPMFQLYLII
ncbi:MAG: type II secretion system F family protein [Bacillota bacterium]